VFDYAEVDCADVAHDVDVALEMVAPEVCGTLRLLNRQREKITAACLRRGGTLVTLHGGAVRNVDAAPSIVGVVRAGLELMNKKQEFAVRLCTRWASRRSGSLGLGTSGAS
jgi:hypothetical protein